MRSEAVGARSDALGVSSAERLEERAKKLQEHFEQAQHCMNSINALCEEADACILKSQTTLNKTAKKIHDLTRRASNLHLGQDAHHAVDDFGEAVHQPEISSRRGKVGRAAAAPAPQLR
ncbi:unnamed protein product [Prorocentrum cordatum]|uniref:Uncharacterized protein n=1 Tax=Prorocentrum cordatum TaxID=2364126 RepID=A0ABN9UBF9_9DINO|nr:unnamed protein product [Polarella glacialis]